MVKSHVAGSHETFDEIIAELKQTKYTVTYYDDTDKKEQEYFAEGAKYLYNKQIVPGQEVDTHDVVSCNVTWQRTVRKWFEGREDRKREQVSKFVKEVVQSLGMNPPDIKGICGAHVFEWNICPRMKMLPLTLFYHALSHNRHRRSP